MSLRASSEDVMLVFCLLLGILLCSAELLSDKLLTQQQQQQPLFLCLSFCRSPTSFHFLSCSSYISFLFPRPFLFYDVLFVAFSVLSYTKPLHHFLFLCLYYPYSSRYSSRLLFFAFPVLSYHIKSYLMLFYSMHLHPSLFICLQYSFRSYETLSHLTLYYPIQSYPTPSYFITLWLFACPMPSRFSIQSIFLCLYPTLSYPILSDPIQSSPISHPLLFLCQSYLFIQVLHSLFCLFSLNLWLCFTVLCLFIPILCYTIL